ncbi:MAG TPA: FAD-dependent oxidoreductase, partial [Solirubrobacteraceae bacterium]|nr:FAD-dependent oxidoreductase [Solirubrobacteraceae bacterium]
DGIGNMQQVGRNGLHRYNNSDHSMLSAMRAVDNILHGTGHDIWEVNVESVYHEEATDEEDLQPYKEAPVTPSLREELAHREAA